MEKRSSSPTFEEQNGFMTPAFFDNPYPYYHQLRAHEPIHWSDKTQSWLVTRHSDVSAGLRDRRFSVKRGNVNIDKLPSDVQNELHPLRSFYSLWLMYMDPPDHTRLRKLVGQALSPKVVESMKPGIEETVDQHISQINGRDRFDLVKDFAKPLAITAMAKIFDIPPDGYSKIEEWSNKLVGFLGMRDVDADKARETQDALFELSAYMMPIFRERRADPKDDLISQLIIAREKDERLSEGEVFASSINVLIDGHEPVANSIANGTLAFLRNPEQIDKLNRNPGLASTAVDEILRYDPPFQYSARRATNDVQIGDKLILAGQRVQFMLGAANRNPDSFPDPDKFDISRSDNKQHASFGFGSHYCIGAPFGRAILTSTFEKLSERLPHFSLPEQQLEWHQSIGYRGLKSLTIAA